MALTNSSIALHILEDVKKFQDKYGFLPGDLPDAENILPNCKGCNPPKETAGDGIIGSADFSLTLRRSTHPKENDETELFWRHLKAAGAEVSRTNRMGQFEVGYANGEPLPAKFGFGNAPKGTILVFMNQEALDGAPADARGQQLATPTRAYFFDNKKIDDGGPDTGWIQAYGASSCVIPKEKVPLKNRHYANKAAAYQYNQVNKSRDCGIMYLLEEYCSIMHPSEEC